MRSYQEKVTGNSSITSYPGNGNFPPIETTNGYVNNVWIQKFCRKSIGIGARNRFRNPASGSRGKFAGFGRFRPYIFDLGSYGSLAAGRDRSRWRKYDSKIILFPTLSEDDVRSPCFDSEIYFWPNHQLSLLFKSLSDKIDEKTD